MNLYPTWKHDHCMQCFAAQPSEMAGGSMFGSEQSVDLIDNSDIVFFCSLAWLLYSETKLTYRNVLRTQNHVSFRRCFVGRMSPVDRYLPCSSWQTSSYICWLGLTFMAGLGLRPAFACSNQIQSRKNDVSKLLHHAGLYALHYLHVSPVSEVSFNSKLRLSVYVVFTDTISSFGLVHFRQIWDWLSDT